MIITPCEQGLRVECPAKLNLFLELHGKRPDGYHALETVMVTVGLFDTLDFRRESTDKVRLACFEAGPPTDDESPPEESLPTDERNLVVQAANLLRKHAGITEGVNISLHKRIPAQAGLAGGSSDAAATLATLNRLWQLDLPREELQSLAAQLGSDIPFFLAESPFALCTGRGEIITPLKPVCRLWAVIVRPAVGLSTADVFRNCHISQSPRSAQPLIDRLVSGDHADLEQYLHNSLQESASQLCPALEELAHEYAACPDVVAQMSGSGTAWFGICRNRAHARRTAARLNARGLGRVFVAETCP